MQILQEQISVPAGTTVSRKYWCISESSYRHGCRYPVPGTVTWRLYRHLSSTKFHLPVPGFRHPCRNDGVSQILVYFGVVIPAWMPVSSARDGNLAALQALEQYKVSPPCAWVPASLPERRCLANTGVSRSRHAGRDAGIQRQGR